MQSPVRFISVLSLFLLSSVFCRAEKDPVQHVFHTKEGCPELVYRDDNHVAKTDLVKYYTCRNGAEFGLDLVNSPSVKKISINFSGNGQMMTTSAIDSLAGLNFYYFYRTDQNPNIELRLSRDSVHWSSPIDLVVNSSSNTRRVETSFVPGRYFVRLTSKNSHVASIFEMWYYFGGCNCFMYIPE